MRRKPGLKDVVMAKRGLAEARNAIKKCDVVILDEINVALKLNLIKLGDLLKLIKKTPQKTELILTGRHAHPQIVKMADLVSEIKEKKHYYKKGIKGRKGIEF